jgi:hypothetical protein
VSDSVYFVSEGQITQPPTIMFGQIVIQRHVSMSARQNYYAALWPVENSRLGVPTMFVFNNLPLKFQFDFIVVVKI